MIIEVELSESDDDAEMDGPRDDEDDNNNVFKKLDDMLQPWKREQRYKEKIKVIG